MRWWWYLTPFGWIQAYLSASILVHEVGHLVAAKLTGHRVVGLKVGRADPAYAFSFRDVLFEFSGDAMGGRVRVDMSVPVTQTAILVTALAGPLANVVSAMILLLMAAATARCGLPAGIRMWMVSALALVALAEATHGLSSIPREIRNILKK